MHVKLLVFNLIITLVIFNVMAQQVDNTIDDDEEFAQYKASLRKAYDLIRKNLNTHEIESLQRRSWLSQVWHENIKPALAVGAGEYVKKVVFGGKRSFDEDEALKAES